MQTDKEKLEMHLKRLKCLIEEIDAIDYSISILKEARQDLEDTLGLTRHAIRNLEEKK